MCQPLIKRQGIHVKAFRKYSGNPQFLLKFIRDDNTMGLWAWSCNKATVFKVEDSSASTCLKKGWKFCSNEKTLTSFTMGGGRNCTSKFNITEIKSDSAFLYNQSAVSMGRSLMNTPKEMVHWRLVYYWGLPHTLCKLKTLTWTLHSNWCNETNRVPLNGQQNCTLVSVGDTDMWNWHGRSDVYNISLYVKNYGDGMKFWGYCGKQY